MKILFINHTFYPDVVASAQYAADLAFALATRGHEVHVMAAQRAYDDPARLYPANETWYGVRIDRIRSLGLGRSAKWRRYVSFASFLLSSCFYLVRAPRYDAVIALTSPPLVSFLGALLTRLRGGRLVYWIMDLNPDEAVAAGWLAQDAWLTRVLEWMLKFSLDSCASVIVLDRYMHDRITAKGVPAHKLITIPPWPQDAVVAPDPADVRRFRQSNGWDNKFVVVYAGNHSPCHPLDTILAAAAKLSGNPDILFAFVGGGSELPKVRQFAIDHGLTNMTFLPYQPFSLLPALLSAADLHLVVMGDQFVGVIHPCKIYNILAAGGPVLYVGPKPSHVTELGDRLDGLIQRVAHGDVEGAAARILAAHAEYGCGKSDWETGLAHCASQQTSMEGLILAVESLYRSPGAPSPSPEKTL